MNHVGGGKRRTIVKTNPFLETKYPFLALEFPRLGEHAIIFFARVIDVDQRLDHILPDAILGTRTVGIGVKRIETDAAKNGEPLFRSCETVAGSRRYVGSGAETWQCFSLVFGLVRPDQKLLR